MVVMGKTRLRVFIYFCGSISVPDLELYVYSDYQLKLRSSIYQTVLGTQSYWIR
jgi:hypothetical protein